MNKIYLDKLLEFTHTTYSNYYAQYNKHFELNDEITKIKQNTSLNEKGAFIKYSFVDLSSLISSIEHDEVVLIYPICFNIEENQEWFNLLNSLLLILNEDYIKESNIAKKKMLQMADKMYKKHLTIDKNLNETNYAKISELTNLNLIILSNENNILRVGRYEKSNINKWVVCYKFSNYYFPVWNFEKKYFDSGSTFIKYLLTLSSKNNSNLTMTDDTSTNDTSTNGTSTYGNVLDEINATSDLITKTVNHNTPSPISTPNKTTDEKILIKGKIKNNEGYEEFITNEDYALYISEAVDTKNTQNIQKQKLKKNAEPLVCVTGEKKKNKSNKNIFVTLEQPEIKAENIIDDETEKNNNIDSNRNKVKIIANNKKSNSYMDDTVDHVDPIDPIDLVDPIDPIDLVDPVDESVFKKTEIIDKNKISQIISNIKSTTKLEQIQSFALELGLSIVSGSTKDGKPKNKTKNEIVDEIKKLKLSTK
jgi:hypothetical protein